MKYHDIESKWMTMVKIKELSMFYIHSLIMILDKLCGMQGNNMNDSIFCVI